MIPYQFGEFKEEQMEEYKKKLHDKMYFLLLYVDPKTKDTFDEKPNVDKYFHFLLCELDGLNRLFDYPKEVVEMMSILRHAKQMLKWDNFYYPYYRKLVLDAHSLIDKMFTDYEKEVNTDD